MQAREHEEELPEARPKVLPRERTVQERPGYRVTFHTSSRPMAGTNSQVKHPTRSFVPLMPSSCDPYVRGN